MIQIDVVDIVDFKIKEYFELNPTGKIIIQAFTGSGLVASIVAHHLIEKFDMIEKGYISSSLIPNVGIVREGVIQRPIQIYENDSFIVLLCEIGIDQENLVSFIEKLFEWYVSVDPASIVIVGALPTGRPANATDLRYNVVASDQMTREFLNNKGIWTMPQGAVYGSVALSLMEAKKSDISAYAVLSHCIATIPDYLAAKKVVEIIQNSIGVDIPISPLDKNARELRDHLVAREDDEDIELDVDIEDFELYDDYDGDEFEDDDLSKFI